MIQVVDAADRKALEGCLAADPTENLFLLGVLEAGGPGAFFGDPASGVVYIENGRLAVPAVRRPAYAAEIGRWLRENGEGFRLAVGNRAAVDALWEGFGGAAPRLSQAHQLYRITAEEMGPLVTPQLRKATDEDLEAVVRNAAAMQLEDLGADPLRTNPEGFRRRIADRIAAGRIWVLHDQGELAFQVQVGTWCSQGAQLEGVYTDPVFRGLGLAAKGLGQLCRTLLASLPQVTLGVNEANTPAVALYEKLGFVPVRPFRLISA